MVAREVRETYSGRKEDYLVVGLEHITPGEIVLSSWNQPGENSFSKSFKKGDILFGRRRAYLKKAAVAPFDGICSGDITVIRAIPGKISPRLLPFVLQCDEFFEYAVGKSAGSLSPRVKWEHWKNYEFLLPESDAEQENIADMLWAADDACRAYQQLFQKTDDLIMTSLRKMVATSKLKNTLGSFVARYSPQRCKNRKLPVLSVTKEKAIVLQDERFESTVASRDKSNYLIVPKGYIVQGIHIDEGNFGLQNLVDEGIVSPAYKIWRIKSKEIVPELLEYYLRSQDAIQYYNNNFQGTTVKRRQTIRSEDLLAMPLNFPDLDTQRRFWGFKELCEKSKASIQETLLQARKLKRTIMKEKGLIK